MLFDDQQESNDHQGLLSSHLVPEFFRWISNHHPPHTLSYCDRRETLYASHPSLGTVTQSHLPTSTTRLLVPRGILRDPTTLCYVNASFRTHSDADDDEYDDLYFADSKGCRIWRMRLGEDLGVNAPELLYQSYRSPSPMKHLQSLADYQRDDASANAQVARKDERMRIRGIAVAQGRQMMFWCQGCCVMGCGLSFGFGQRADTRSDVLVVAEGSQFERAEQIWVDAEERWLCVRDSVTGDEHRLFLGGLSTDKAESMTQDNDSEEIENQLPAPTVATFTGLS